MGEANEAAGFLRLIHDLVEAGVIEQERATDKLTRIRIEPQDGPQPSTTQALDRLERDQQRLRGARGSSAKVSVDEARWAKRPQPVLDAEEAGRAKRDYARVKLPLGAG